MKTRKKISGVGVVIREFRHQAGLSQDTLADRMDVSTSYISMLEGGKRYPSMEMLIRLAIALEAPAGVILDRIAERCQVTPAFRGAGASNGAQNFILLSIGLSGWLVLCRQPKKKDLQKPTKNLTCCESQVVVCFQHNTTNSMSYPCHSKKFSTPN